MVINWLVYPVLLTVASAGQGLLIRRLLRGPSGLLVLPVGFALMVVLTTLCMRTGLHGKAWLGAVVPAVIGLAVGHGDLRALTRVPRSEWSWPVASALGAFAVFALPVVLTGRNTFTGFTMITDIANHFDLAAQLKAAGHAMPTPIDSSFAESVRKLFGANYPTGLHSLLGGWSELLGRELAWMYQPTVAFAAPMGALAVFAVLRHADLAAPIRALGATVAIQPTLLFSYSLAAGFKELYASVLILTTVAALGEAFDARDRRLLVPLIPMVAGYDAFSMAIGPWMGLAVAVFGIALLLRVPRIARLHPAKLAAGMAALVALAVLVLPAVRNSTSLSSTPGVEEVVKSQTDLGNLAKPLDPLTSVGPWLTGDYRFPLTTHVGLTHVLIYVTLALALLGTLSVLWRRRPEIAALAVAAAVTLIVVLPTTGPWVDAKLYAITGVLVLTLSFFGVGALAGVRRRGAVVLGAVVAAVIAGGVLYGNALAVHNTTPAPERRLSELEAIAKRFAGQGPALVPSFDEYAEYFLRGIKATGRVNPPAGFPGDAPQFGADLDQISYDFVKGFPLIVLRRNPARSRPPSNYALAWRSRFYDVWRRQPDRPPIFAHLPLPAGRSDRTRALCRNLAAQVAGIHDADHLEWSLMRRYTSWQPLQGSTWTPNWQPDPAGAALRTRGPGHAQGRVDIPVSGSYRLWQTGSFERPLTISVDGRRVATLAGLSDYPGEAVLAADVHLSKGSHRVEVRRGGGSLTPGNGDASGSRYVGPLLFEPVRQARTTFTTRPAAAERICRSGRHLDWVEVLGPSA